MTMWIFLSLHYADFCLKFAGKPKRDLATGMDGKTEQRNSRLTIFLAAEGPVFHQHEKHVNQKKLLIISCK